MGLELRVKFDFWLGAARAEGDGAPTCKKKGDHLTRLLRERSLEIKWGLSILKTPRYKKAMVYD